MPALTYVGEISVGSLCPVVLTVFAPILASVQARLTGCTNLLAKMAIAPPEIATNLKLAVQLVAGLTVAVAQVPPAPGIPLQMQAVLGTVASLEVSIKALGALQAVL